MKTGLWNSIPESWRSGLANARSDITEIDELLSRAKRAGVIITPDREDIFAALTLAPEAVSVVVIGQDPYPTLGYATGLAFAVPTGTKPLPGSLRNIFKEVATDTGNPATSDCTLSGWMNQGVLLLNTSLTTELGVRAGHASWPWEHIIQTALQLVVSKNPEVIAVLWGKNAKKYSNLFDPKLVVESAHPSPLSANRGFLGSKPFTRVNEILLKLGKPVIVW